MCDYNDDCLTGICNSGVCDIQVMGNDGSNLTQRYPNPGDIITYKIFVEGGGPTSLHQSETTSIFESLGIIHLDWGEGEGNRQNI